MTRPSLVLRAVAPALWLAATCLMPAPAPAQAPKQGQEKAKTQTEAAAPIDLNTATAEELETLPGVGPATSRKIIDGRPYKAIDDLKAAGVAQATLDRIRLLVVVDAPKPAPDPAARKAETRKPAAPTPPPDAAGPVDVNRAGAAELESLPGVGPALARAIIDARPYEKVEDLGRVKGLGDAKLAAIRDRVTVGATTRPEPPAGPAAAPKAKAKAEGKSASRKDRPVADPNRKVNINTATPEELDSLFGIGPVKARAIIDARPFKTIEDVKNARGVGEVTFERIKDRITVD